MNNLQDTLYVNKEALRHALPKFRHLPLLSASFVIYQLVQFLVSLLGSRMGMGIGFLWGFVVYLVNIAVMAHFLSLLYNVIRYDRLTPGDLTNPQFTRLMPALIQAFFVLYIIELLFSMLLSPMLPGLFTTLILILWEGAKTPVQENVYLGNRYGTAALMATVDFWKNNLLQWAPVLVVAVVFNLFVNPLINRLSFGSFWLMPLVWLVTGIFVSAWMIWRGELFDQLDSSSLRSRAYRRQNYR